MADFGKRAEDRGEEPTRVIVARIEERLKGYQENLNKHQNDDDKAFTELRICQKSTESFMLKCTGAITAIVIFVGWAITAWGKH